MKYLDFDNEKYEKGYEPFIITKESVLKNKGKRIVYVTKRDVDAHRGYVFPQYGVLDDMKYSTVCLSNGDTIDKRDIIECGIKIDDTSTITQQQLSAESKDSTLPNGNVR